MKLNKKICVDCRNTRVGGKWTEADEDRWKHGEIWCPMTRSSSALQLIGRELRFCPFKLEHVVTGVEVKPYEAD